MKRWIIIALIVLLPAAPALAGSYTVTTSANEDQALQTSLDEVINPRRAKNFQAPWTLTQYVQHLFNENLRSVKEQFDADEVSKSCLAYRELSEPDRITVRTLLGGRSPCR